MVAILHFPLSLGDSLKKIERWNRDRFWIWPWGWLNVAHEDFRIIWLSRMIKTRKWTGDEPQKDVTQKRYRQDTMWITINTSPLQSDVCSARQRTSPPLASFSPATTNNILNTDRSNVQTFPGADTESPSYCSTRDSRPFVQESAEGSRRNNTKNMSRQINSYVLTNFRMGG